MGIERSSGGHVLLEVGQCGIGMGSGSMVKVYRHHCSGI